MSRSTKKPFYTDQQTNRPAASKPKDWANRKVRKTKDVPSGASYKKVFSSWDIRDWSFHRPKDKKAYRK